MSEANETHAEVIADMRKMYPASPNCEPTVSGQFVHDEMEWLAKRLEAAYRREAQSIERIVRDAIISYTEQYVYAPNDSVEREIRQRAEVANNWLKQHGFDEEPTNWSKEEAPCL